VYTEHSNYYKYGGTTMMQVEPTQEHRWLQRLVGEWTHEMIEGEPGKPVEVIGRGTERVRALGDLWVVGEGEAEMSGGECGSSIITLGFDPRKQRFVGTWVGSMMAQLWVYDGALDSSGTVLTLESEGPHMTREGELGTYRDVIELTEAGERTMNSFMLDESGEWQHFVSMNYERVGT
jgi:hypothetical protein